MSEKKKFVTRRREIKIDIENENGQVEEHTLRELSGTERDKFLNIMASKMKVGHDGKPAGVKDFTGLHADLIVKSLFNSENKNVPAEVIQSWPSSVQTEIFKMAQELSGLNQQAEAEAKNE